MRRLEIPLLIAAGTVTAAAIAQEHPFIGEYALMELDGGVRIAWTIQAGNTCNGQDVERSTNGTDFFAVHRVAGICGNISAPVPYEWIDPAPPELSTLHYRIKLGFDGYSSVRSITFDQLTTSEQRIYPSPTTGPTMLVLNVPTGTPVDLLIWDACGRLVVERSGIAGPTIAFDMGPQRAGLYSYRASADGRIFQGRFVKE